MQFAGTFNVYRSLRLAADTPLRPGGWQGARRGLFDSPVYSNGRVVSLDKGFGLTMYANLFSRTT